MTSLLGCNVVTNKSIAGLETTKKNIKNMERALQCSLGSIVSEVARLKCLQEADAIFGSFAADNTQHPNLKWKSRDINQERNNRPK